MNGRLTKRGGRAGRLRSWGWWWRARGSRRCRKLSSVKSLASLPSPCNSKARTPLSLLGTPFFPLSSPSSLSSLCSLSSPSSLPLLRSPFPDPRSWCKLTHVRSPLGGIQGACAARRRHETKSGTSVRKRARDLGSGRGRQAASERARERD